jgi:hypothetical protein
MKKRTSKKLEGEGSYTGTRGYNAGLAEHVKNANIGALADEALKALEGEEGKELRKAEKIAKKGPQGLRPHR